MINHKVKHVTFGEGVIVGVKDGSKPFEKYLSIKFEIGNKSFVFPSAFEKMLTTDCSELNLMVAEASAKIAKIAEEEKRLKEIETLKKQIKKHENQLTYFGKGNPSNKTYEIGNQLKRGFNYGTVAEKVYENCCDKFDWRLGEKGKFGKQKKLYSDIATLEGYSVWFLAHNNYMDESLDEAIAARNVYNKVSETYMEQWWGTSNHPRAGERKRVIFAKQNGCYVFLGIYRFVGTRRTEQIGGKNYYVERFDLVCENYPDQQ